MFGWIESVIDSFANSVSDAIRAFVKFVIRGFYGYLHGLFSLAWDAWSFYWQMANILARGMSALANGLYSFGYRVIHGWIPWLIDQITGFYHAAINFGESILQSLSHYISDVLNWAQQAINDVIRWVTDNVYNPLAHFISTALDWISKEGNTLWYYLTHPDKLAELLFDYLIALLESLAWDVGARLGKFFLSLVVRNIVQFATLIENVIDAIL